MLTKFFQNADKKQAIAWAFYDFANSSYSLLIMSFVFPIYFKERIAGVERGDFFWGLVVSVSILLGGLLAPIIGAMADHEGRRKAKFEFFALLAITGTAALYFTGSGTLLTAAILIIITNLSFEIAQTLYDSFLAQVSTPETAGRISGLAWGFGYLGGLLAMLLLAPLYNQGFAGDLESKYKLTFPLTALFFLIFALPVFTFLKESPMGPKFTFFNSLKNGFGKVAATLKNLRNYRNLLWFLLGFYLLNDALVTFFSFVPIYGRTTLNLSFAEMTSLLVLIQLIGFPSATIFGILSDRRGSKKILLLTISIWSVIMVLSALAQQKWQFYLIALLIALVIGASQAVARSWLSRLVPEEKRFEFFGFNGFASKIAATSGPLVFGTVSILTGNQRLAVLSLLPFLIASLLIFSRIKETRPTPS